MTTVDEEDPVSAGVVRAVAAACLLGCGLLVLHALILGMHVEATPQALEDADRGRAVGYPAAAGAVAALVAMAGAGRRWGTGALAVGLVLGLLALGLDVRG